MAIAERSEATANATAQKLTAEVARLKTQLSTVNEAQLREAATAAEARMAGRVAELEKSAATAIAQAVAQAEAAVESAAAAERAEARAAALEEQFNATAVERGELVSDAVRVSAASAAEAEAKASAAIAELATAREQHAEAIRIYELELSEAVRRWPINRQRRPQSTLRCSRQRRSLMW